VADWPKQLRSLADALRLLDGHSSSGLRFGCRVSLARLSGGDDARLERSHQIHNLGSRGTCNGLLKRFADSLALDQIEHVLAVLVTVLRQFELCRQRVDKSSWTSCSAEPPRRSARQLASKCVCIHADGDYVVIEHTGRNETPDGRRYENNYCWVFRFEQGMIQKVS
jgi:hypothetical protein